MNTPNTSTLLLCDILRMFEDLIDSVALIAHPSQSPTATESLVHDTTLDADADTTVLESAAVNLL